MITIQNKKDCCGCTACASVCPEKCIEMKRDAEGFVYPEIGVSKCRNCRACEAVCPILKKWQVGEVKEAYVVQDKRLHIRESSSSGGAFTAMAEYVIDKGGTVYGAAYDDHYFVYHVGVNNAVSIEKFRGSKYVQSDVSGIYTEIRKRLTNNEWVLFSGTPCQVAGLKSFLKKEWDTLVTVDIACHGVPSPKLWEIYLGWWRNKENCDFKSVEFRSKKFGYSGSTMLLKFENGREFSSGSMLQLHKNTMFAGLSLRPSCYDCHFKTVSRLSDYTIFDCWDVNLFCPEMDDDCGTTALLVQSERGNRLLAEISETWRIHSVNVETIIGNDGDMILKNATFNPRREQFFADLETLNLSELNRKYFPTTLKQKLIQMLKPIFYRIGILDKVKRKMK